MVTTSKSLTPAKQGIFFIQGCGRGHLTQAISLKKILSTLNCKITHIFIAADENSGHELYYEFLKSDFDCKITIIDSPKFITNKNKGINKLKTITHNILSLPCYFKQAKKIKKFITESAKSIDFIVNFYEPLFGLFNSICKIPPHIDVFSIGHQYMVFDKDYSSIPGFIIDRIFMKLYTYCISRHSNVIALSFYPKQIGSVKNVTVLPPLIREDVLKIKYSPTNIPTITQDNSNTPTCLIYIGNNGYKENIINLAKKFSSAHCQFYCFCKKFWETGIGEEYWYLSNLTFVNINKDKFLNFLSGCDMFISTAGFESICEATYLGKKQYIVPIDNHCEQNLNGDDAEVNGLATQGMSFDDNAAIFFIENTIKTLKGQNIKNKTFNDERRAKFVEWVDDSERVYKGYFVNKLGL